MSEHFSKARTTSEMREWKSGLKDTLVVCKVRAARQPRPMTFGTGVLMCLFEV